MCAVWEIQYNTNKKLFLTLFASELKDNMDCSNYTELEESRKSLKTAYINLAKSFYWQTDQNDSILTSFK